jgi:hypothetical protein
MKVGKSLECLTRETKESGENQPQFRFVHNKSHVTLPELEPWPQHWEPTNNRLSYGMACVIILAMELLVM